MPEINLAINGIRGDALERFAALAGKKPDELILSWIEDRLNYAVVVSMRASGETWDSVAGALGISITQARRIYADGSEFQPIGKDEVKAAEKYLKILEEIREITSNESELFPVPTEDDLDMIQKYWDAIPPEGDLKGAFPVPCQSDLDAIQEYNEALPDFESIRFEIPSTEDLERVREYAELTSED